jgi:hypothetical protein
MPELDKILRQMLSNVSYKLPRPSRKIKGYYVCYAEPCKGTKTRLTRNGDFSETKGTFTTQVAE